MRFLKISHLITCVCIHEKTSTNQTSKKYGNRRMARFG